MLWFAGWIARISDSHPGIGGSKIITPPIHNTIALLSLQELEGSVVYASVSTNKH